MVDAWTHKSKNTTFRFNVCSNAVTPSRCVNTSGGAGEVMHGPAPAYQILSVEGESQEQCYRLGSSVSNGSNVRLGVVDTAHPARGVYVRYSHGNTCDEGTEYDSESASRCSPIVKDGESACTRSFQLNVLCANTITDLPTTAQVEELSPCAFRLTLSSVYGCPIECPTDEVHSIPGPGLFAVSCSCQYRLAGMNSLSFFLPPLSVPWTIYNHCTGSVGCAV